MESMTNSSMRYMLDLQVCWAQRLANALWRARHDGSDFSIIGDNCWGGFIYQHFRRPYLSPFVGLFLATPCYLRLLEDLHGYLAHPPRQANDSCYENLRKLRGNVFPVYPIGLLGDGIEIHFLHYRTWDEALAKWMRRVSRICWNRLFVKLTDRGESSPDLARRFLSLPYERKLYVTNRTDVFGPEVLCLGGSGALTVGQGTWEFRRHLDVPAWLSVGPARGGAALRCLSRRADAFLAAAATRQEHARLAAGASADPIGG